MKIVVLVSLAFSGVAAWAVACVLLEASVVSELELVVLLLVAYHCGGECGVVYYTSYMSESFNRPWLCSLPQDSCCTALASALPTASCHMLDL